MQIKQYLAIALTPLLLTGCFGGAENDTTDSDSNVYQGSDFSITVAPDWETIEREDFTSNVSPQTAVAFRSNKRSEVFTANINVTISNVEEGVSASDFAKSNLSKIRGSLLSYQEGESSTITIRRGEEEIDGYKVSFSGKQGPSQPIVQFTQVYTVNGEQGYQATGAYLANEDESVVKQVGEMLDSLSLR